LKRTPDFSLAGIKVLTGGAVTEIMYSDVMTGMVLLLATGAKVGGGAPAEGFTVGKGLAMPLMGSRSMASAGSADLSRSLVVETAELLDCGGLVWLYPRKPELISSNE
jgi:hypothetical protein